MRTPRLVVLPCVLGLGAVAEWAATRREPIGQAASAADLRLAAVDLAAGAVLAVAGASVLGRRPGDRTGVLLAAASLTWFFGTFADSGVASYASFGAPFVALHRGPLVHALLSYPSGRLARTSERLAVGSVYILSAVPALSNTEAGLVITASIVCVAALRRLTAASGPQRHARLVAALGAAAVAAVLVTSAVVEARGSGVFGARSVLWAYDIVVSMVAASLAVDLRRHMWAESAVTQLVVDLGGGRERSTLRDRLAHALGDDSLRLGYFIPERDEYVDDLGVVVDPAAIDGSRVVTTLRHAGAPAGVLVHEEGLDDPELVESVAAAARLAVANARLQEEVRRQVEELRASRRRIVEAADAQRRRIEAAIRNGPERELREAMTALAAVAATSSADPELACALDETRAELEHAQRELGEFARGVHPRTLTERGLAGALEELVRRSAIPVELTVLEGRLPAAVEETAFFVCSEALANVAKHANAARARIDAREGTPGRLVVEVRDDGRGGASLDTGSGLRGLADRVEALGGRFTAASDEGRGTWICAELPCR